MIGIVVQLLISWVLLHFIEKQNLSPLGLMPNRERVMGFATGLLLSMGFVCIFWGVTSMLVGNPYRLNLVYTFEDFLKSLWYVVNSVIFEELIFRGALLYILIRRVGGWKAVLISAAGFGVYHWFSFGLFGNWGGMVITFFTTGLVGYVLAIAYRKSGSLYMPMALHLGYNVASMIIFSNDKPIGPQLLVKTFENDPVVPGWYISIPVVAVYYLGFPLVSYLWVKRMKGESVVSRR